MATTRPTKPAAKPKPASAPVRKPKARPAPAVDLSHVPERWRALPELRPRPWRLTSRDPQTGEVYVIDEAKGWNAQTRAWWDEVVGSQMAHEYLASDWNTLFMAAVIVDDFWWSGDPKLMSEIRAQLSQYGLSPLDRHRLKWESRKIAAAERNERAKPGREAAKAAHPASQPKKPDDPRRRHLQLAK